MRRLLPALSPRLLCRILPPLLAGVVALSAGAVAAEEVSDEQLLEIEQQIEALEAEQAQAKREAERAAQRRTEEEAEARKAAEETARREAAAQAAAEQQAREQAAARDQERARRHAMMSEQADTHLRNNRFREAADGFAALLAEFPGDARAAAGREEAEALSRVCAGIAGKWKASHGPVWDVRPDHTVGGKWLLFSAAGQWECVDARTREFVVRWPDHGWVDYFFLSEDGNTLSPSRGADFSASRLSH